MHRPPEGDLTRLLSAWSGGDREALEQLLPLVYSELRRRAEGQMRRERAEHTLQPTALVHEAYLKLAGRVGVKWKDRAHFFAVVSRAMRQILVDHARSRRTVRRGGREVRLAVDDPALASAPMSLDVLALDRALERLETLDGRRARLVEMRVFGGMTVAQAAVALGCSHATVSREWQHAGAWLRREMAGSGDQGPEEVRQIGPYTLLSELGHGGMGTVHLAERSGQAHGRRVAIKLLARGRDGALDLARFRAERKILARLDHPNIARLLGGGTTADGVPYLVMEYVNGTHVHEYADSARLGVGARIALFQKICAAVSFAHRRGVVHLDIKPGNVLVTRDGVPKLLDFGLARLLGPGTGPGPAPARMLTPRYASPEQIRGEAVTTASDVYSLGVMLYRLLTGGSPYRVARGSEEDVSRAVLEDAPRSARRLGEDLDAILKKALRKRPAGRHRSVREFSGELRRLPSP